MLEGALLNPVDMPSLQEAVLEIAGGLESISVVVIWWLENVIMTRLQWRMRFSQRC